ncbi:MAG: polysaccharide deacetylase family protein [Candidatus Eremiobacteraeota bacterium]|nr:polysaccharide deacetylase family protein [Candidatus Eremiobacteraeota bacterium]
MTRPRLLRGLLRFAIAGAMLALLVFAGYELFEQPTNSLFGPAITHGPSNEKVVALTYDDGPNPPYTSKILDVLAEEHVHATFFLVGRAVAAFPEVVQREVRDGNAIGNHTWDHRHLIVMSQRQIRRSLELTDDAIYSAVQQRPRLMRPPFGARDWFVMRVAHSMGFEVVMWSVPLPRDWEYPPATVIARRVLSHVRDGSIIVLHDGNRGYLCASQHMPPRTCDRTQDIEATRLIVRALKAQGYRFLTIPEMNEELARHNEVKHTPAPGIE